MTYWHLHGLAMKAKILYVVTAGGWGGAPRHVLQLMEYMVKAGYAVGLVSGPEPKLMRGAGALGVEIFVNRHFVRPIRLVNDLKAVMPVIMAVKSFEPDLIHAHSTKAGYAARIAGAMFQKPTIFTAHGWAFTEGKSTFQRCSFAFAEKLAAAVTRKIICVSSYDLELALRCKVAPQNKLRLIYNGVDPDAFLNAGTGALDMAGVATGMKGDPIVAFVGRLAPPKDVETLLQSLKKVRSCKAIIVGDGPLRSSIKRSIYSLGLSNRVFLLGERNDVPSILASSDVFVLPSNWEGLPYTVIEAMMAGLPVVATSVGGVPELVEDGVTGFLVPRSDPEALAEALQRLIDDPELRERMGKAGRQKAMCEFTLDRMLRETEKVYEKVLGREL